MHDPRLLVRGIEARKCFACHKHRSLEHCTCRRQHDVGVLFIQQYSSVSLEERRAPPLESLDIGEQATVFVQASCPFPEGRHEGRLGFVAKRIAGGPSENGNSAWFGNRSMLSPLEDRSRLRSEGSRHPDDRLSRERFEPAELDEDLFVAPTLRQVDPQRIRIPTVRFDLEGDVPVVPDECEPGYLQLVRGERAAGKRLVSQPCDQASSLRHLRIPSTDPYRDRSWRAPGPRPMSSG